MIADCNVVKGDTINFSKALLRYDESGKSILDIVSEAKIV